MEITEYLRSPRTEKVYVGEFKGINRTASAEDGYFYRSENMSGKAYPAASVRGRRAIIRPLTSCDGFCGDDTLIWVENGKLYYGGNELSDVHLTEGRKEILRLGSYILVFPDLVYRNISDPEDSGSISHSYTAEEGMRISMTDESFQQISDFYIATELPKTAVSGEICALVSGDAAPVIKRFDGHSFKTVKTFIKLEGAGIGAGFQVGDTLECAGLERYVGDHFTVAKKEASALYCEGVVLTPGEVASVYISRVMPLYDHITVSGNRIYAVRRGYDRDGNFVSRIYASAKGDPKNWSVYGGGLVADCDLHGEFTAVADYLGSPVAFTENALAEIREKNGYLTVTSVVGDGVEKGAANSCKSVGYRLYYKGKRGVFSYDGSYPKCISLGLEDGLCVTSDGVPGAAYGGKYYVKLSSTKETTAIYIYDVFDKQWQREDDPGVVSFAVRGGGLYASFEDPSSENEKCGLLLFGYDESADEEKSYCAPLGYPVPEQRVAWYCESGKIGLDGLSGVYPVRLNLRVKVRDGGDMSVALIYDENETAEKAISIPKRTVGAITVPVAIKKCDTLRIRFSGHGSCEILGYEISYQNGGEVRGWR